MRLELATFSVERIRFGPTTLLAGAQLAIAPDELRPLAAAEEAIAAVHLDLAHPGESVRLVHVLDMVEPRVKLSGRGCAFPGFLGPTDTVGDGRTHRLACHVVQTATYPQPTSGLLRPREGIVEMSGPGAAYCVGSAVPSLVLNFVAQPDASNEAFDAAIRRATLQVAARLAETTREASLTPASVDVFEQTPVDPALPRLVYVYQLQSQGLFADTYLYGEDARRLLPTLMHPNEPFDGALVSGNYVFSGMKVPTTSHCNNAVIRELYAEHGRRLNFVGVILHEGHNKTLESKRRAADWAAKLALLLRADGAILSQESGGMSVVDQMLTCQRLEAAGIKTTLLSYEMSGPEGLDNPLIYSLSEADAIVSTGNREQIIQLPAVERVIGGETLIDEETPAGGPIETSLVRLYSAVNQTGGLRLRAYQY